MKSRMKGALLAATLAVLGACHSSQPPQNLQLKALNALPPGQSGLVTADGQAAGRASGNPADYGEHIDDQRLMFWNYQYKDGSFNQPGTALAVPSHPEIQVSLDSFGVPTVTAATVHDIWFGVGYVAARQRLFVMDAVRRLGRGTAGALFGCTYVPGDVQTRILTYTDAEYLEFFNRIEPDSQAAFQGYVDGANAWVQEVTTTQTSQLPAEYQLLSATPEPFDLIDLMAGSVLITRRVAAEGGDEFFNVSMLRQLEQAYGKADGRNMFQDLVWLEDRKALTTVPADQEFPNQQTPPEGREAVFNARADWAVTLPNSIWIGPGTGSVAEPSPCTKGADTGTTPASASSGALAPVDAQVAGFFSDLNRLHGGSWAVAIGRSRTRDRGALLISEPQLGYTYPSYLWEAEIHGAGYEARGVSVPGLPAIGIGYTPYVGWALTTGYSKTIDSFVETICSTAQAGAGTCAANQYFHNGQWKDMECRTETIPYRASQKGLPSGPPDLSVTQEVCRTVHGPIVARDDAAGLARSLAYSMWMHEIDNVEGVREWSRARGVGDFLAATAKVSWNENVTFATHLGDIGYVHPGRFPDRHPSMDQRLPTPGTGEFDFRGWLPFERMPHSINPPQGYLFNWNTKPALGWLDGEGWPVNSRPAGRGQRATNLRDAIAPRSDWTVADLQAIDRIAGERDPRAIEYLPVFDRFHTLNFGALSDAEREALALLLSWDRRHLGPEVTVDDPNSTDSAAATIFDAWVKALQQDLFGDLDQYVLYSGDRDLDLDGDNEYAPIDPDTDVPPITIYNRSKAVGSHRFDQSVMDNLILRIFEPASSSLAVRHDWLRGRAPDAVLHSALAAALSTLAQRYGTDDPPSAADVDTFRRVHPKREICSLTDVIGPGSTTPTGECVKMPYQDRGSWAHLIGYEEP